MKTIKIWTVDCNFDDKLTIKHMRKIYPIFTQKLNDLEAAIMVGKILLIDFNWNTNVDEFEKFLDDQDSDELEKIVNLFVEVTNKISAKKKK